VAIEAHLSRRCGELFSIDTKVLLYDVTSTYFEGLAEANPLAQRGYSRDQWVARRQRRIWACSADQGYFLR